MNAWSKDDMAALKEGGRRKDSAAAIAKRVKRSEGAVKQMAAREGIKLGNGAARANPKAKAKAKAKPKSRAKAKARSSARPARLAA